MKEHKLAEGWGREEWGIANWIFMASKNLDDAGHRFLAYPMVTDNQDRTAKRTCRSHPDRQKTRGSIPGYSGALAYKEIKKTGEFVLPGFGKLVNLHTFPKPRVKRIPLIFLMPDHLCLDAREPKWKLSDHKRIHFLVAFRKA